MLQLSYRPEVIKVRFKWYDFIKKDFWKTINNKKEKFNSIFKLNVINYSTEYSPDRYSIDIDKLRKDVVNILPVLKDDFLFAITELKKIQNK